MTRPEQTLYRDIENLSQSQIPIKKSVPFLTNLRLSELRKMCEYMKALKTFFLNGIKDINIIENNNKGME